MFKTFFFIYFHSYASTRQRATCVGLAKLQLKRGEEVLNIQQKLCSANFQYWPYISWIFCTVHLVGDYFYKWYKYKVPHSFSYWTGNPETLLRPAQGPDCFLIKLLLSPLKGVCHEIFDLHFFHYSNPSRPLINRLNYFQIRFRFRRDIRWQSSKN